MRWTGKSVGRLELIAFLGGAAVMVFEIAGSRVLAPFLGTSVFVWTTLIGVIMASLSAGYWWGGLLADRAPTFRRLAGVLFLASLFSGATAVFQESVLRLLQDTNLELRAAALVATLLLFAPASTMLGMVTPFVVRLKLRAIESSGAEVGRLYAISTAGSIVGTFACGYFLLSVMGTSRLLFAIALSLLLLSFLAVAEWRTKERAGVVALLLLAGALSELQSFERAAAGFRDVDTAYQRVQIVDGTDAETQRPVRVLKAEEANAQSSIYLDGDDLRGDYLHLFELLRTRRTPPRRVLMIGAAGYVYPTYLVRAQADVEVDVVEIDPAMTHLARTYFAFADHPRIHVFHEDGRTFVHRATGPYDVVYVDAFQTRVPPFQLLTAEFVRDVRRILAPRGVLTLNFIARMEPEDRGLAPAIVSTFRGVLLRGMVFRVDPSADRDSWQNLVLFASPSPLEFEPKTADEERRFADAKARYARPRSDILTDDFAPVENLAAIQ